jgi:hypothetical protein
VPVYEFQCEMSSTQFTQLQIDNPPLELAVDFEGDCLHMRLFLFGSVSFIVQVAAREHHLSELAEIVTNVLGGQYDATSIYTGAPCMIRVLGVVTAGTRNFANPLCIGSVPKTIAIKEWQISSKRRLSRLVFAKGHRR